MKTIVSITPLAIERDSRTLKQATSMARLGYRSIVLEAEPSRSLRDELPFELVTLRNPEDSTAAEWTEAERSSRSVPTAAATPVLVDRAPSDVEAVEATARASTTPEPDARSWVTVQIDALAARAPSWVRDAAGPHWRALMRSWLWPPTFRMLARGRWARSTPHAIVVYLRTYSRVCRSAARQIPTADLYYLHGQLHFPAVWWRSRKRRVPVVYDAHDLYWTLRTDGRGLRVADRVIWAVWDLVERLCARHAAACVTVGEDVARLATERFGRTFTVIRNAHDHRLDDGDVDDLRTRLGLAEDAFLLAVSGNFKNGMAVRPMMQALRALPARVHLAFIGAGYDEFVREAQDLGVAERVSFVAPVPPSQIVPVLAGADLCPILYYPSSVSVGNAMPNGFFHAIAAGVPVLYPQLLPELRRLADAHGLGWEVDPRSSESLELAVRSILDRPEELEHRRTHADRARDELSWRNEEPALASVLARALNGVRAS